ncbi:amidohydrolase 2 [Mollisia scopiformis]|uniref:Amidohydrolase 2 n=1 Tax=Mollisia scopiformis TaxID=149040 RepID=A0A132B4J4_MOLSC|nr:amidohydrolase 2 [Mollisia scopiformis]KUJ06834.1 amidohydrolase 2 [Mollisia scopiformis]
MVPPLITLEEHFIATDALPNFSGKYSEQLKHVTGLADKLADLGNLRINNMDIGKISLQVISHGPFGHSPSQCRAANEQLSAAVKANPSRFAGFATLPMADPKAAAEELTYAIKDLKFVGALIDNHCDGKYYDGEEYRDFFKTVQELDVPIYFHPTWPSEDMTPRYSGNFSTGAELSLGASGFGWHSEVALHILRLFASGLFDLYPKLNIVIGHFGEMLPFMLGRIQELSPRWGKLERNFKQVWDENIWITTSGIWSLDPMATILRNTKIERILYSVDYPFARNERGLEWMEELEASAMVTKEQLEMIAYKNSEALLKVKLTGQ